MNEKKPTSTSVVYKLESLKKLGIQFRRCGQPLPNTVKLNSNTRVVPAAVRQGPNPSKQQVTVKSNVPSFVVASGNCS
uniref:Uncharacterized protein n=1 Tax=Anopheles dirus TaxID=7168 RepID=A0A182NPI5_9DIPT